MRWFLRELDQPGFRDYLLLQAGRILAPMSDAHDKFDFRDASDAPKSWGPGNWDQRTINEELFRRNPDMRSRR